MSQVIWKFPMPAPGFWRIVEMDENGVCVKSSTQQTLLRAWFKVNPEAPLVRRHFTSVATGQPVPDTLIYHDTIFDGGLVWHLFEDPDAKGQGIQEGRDYA